VFYAFSVLTCLAELGALFLFMTRQVPYAGLLALGLSALLAQLRSQAVVCGYFDATLSIDLLADMAAHLRQHFLFEDNLVILNTTVLLEHMGFSTGGFDCVEAYWTTLVELVCSKRPKICFKHLVSKYVTFTLLT
jgi:hypothetical protein